MQKDRSTSCSRCRRFKTSLKVLDVDFTNHELLENGPRLEHVRPLYPVLARRPLGNMSMYWDPFDPWCKPTTTEGNLAV